MKFLEHLKMLVTSKAAFRFYWNTANGGIAVLATYLAGIDMWYSAIMFAVLNGITREINKKLEATKTLKK